jgi:hypothetical protein
MASGTVTHCNSACFRPVTVIRPDSHHSQNNSERPIVPAETGFTERQEPFLSKLKNKLFFFIAARLFFWPHFMHFAQSTLCLVLHYKQDKKMKFQLKLLDA